MENYETDPQRLVQIAVDRTITHQRRLSQTILVAETQPLPLDGPV
jgi:hypothetical protein